MAKKLKTNYRAGEKILAAMMNSTNQLINDNSEAVESLKRTLLEAALNGGTVNAASNIILSSATGLNASNVQDALAELALEITERTVEIDEENHILTYNGKQYLIIGVDNDSSSTAVAIMGEAIMGVATMGAK